MSWQAVDENLRRAMRMFSLSTERGEARDMPGVTLVSSGVDYSVFNSAMLTSPVADAEIDLDRRAALALTHFSARRLGWSFWLCQNWLDARALKRADSVLSSRGLRRLVETPGMLAAVLAPAARNLPELDWRPVNDDRSRMEFCHVTSIAFHLPFAVAQSIYGAPRFWKGGYQGWVGYRNFQPVTTAATLTTDNTVGLYSVATLPERRNRGYGEAIARHALAKAGSEPGVARYVLQSTSAGHALYERMGYRTVTRFVVYVAE